MVNLRLPASRNLIIAVYSNEYESWQPESRVESMKFALLPKWRMKRFLRPCFVDRVDDVTVFCLKPSELRKAVGAKKKLGFGVPYFITVFLKGTLMK